MLMVFITPFLTSAVPALGLIMPALGFILSAFLYFLPSAAGTIGRPAQLLFLLCGAGQVHPLGPRRLGEQGVWSGEGKPRAWAVRTSKSWAELLPRRTWRWRVLANHDRFGRSGARSWQKRHVEAENGQFCWHRSGFR